VAETKVETTGAPAAVGLSPYGSAIDANGEDVAVFKVSVADSNGRVVPTAGNSILFDIEGPGRIIGVGNGDPSSHEPDTFIPAASSRSRAVEGWRWKKLPDPYPENMAEEGAAYDDSAWEAIDVGSDVGRLGLRERAIYRARLNIDEKDLGAESIELVFGKIAGGISVYVNGHKIGATVDGHNPAVYDVKGLLHPGENVIAVPVASYGSDATGMSKGVMVRLQDAAPAVHWGRSVFNGLAEVIVQSTKAAGTITVTARAEGLQPASYKLTSRPAAPRPSVP
jgi:beta-galactosidase